MLQNGLFTIHEFAKQCFVTRDTLLHYDKLDLLKPAFRGENNYRYYSSSQLPIMKVIRILQNLGMSLEDIKELKDKRTPEVFAQVLEEQLAELDKKIEQLSRARNLMFTQRKIIKSVESIDENAVSIQFLPAEAIALGELNDFSRGKKIYDAERVFYINISRKYPDLDLNYPVWATFSQEAMKRKSYDKPERFYVYNPEGYDRRSAGLYAVGYTRGGYGENSALFERLFDYIKANNFEICGDAYEEYPLDEFCVVNEADYLIRIMIEVREKERR